MSALFVQTPTKTTPRMKYSRGRVWQGRRYAWGAVLVRSTGYTSAIVTLATGNAFSVATIEPYVTWCSGDGQRRTPRVQ